MQKFKILVVDDDPKLSRLVKAILEETCDYEVLEENRSTAAFATAREFMPDMFVLDVNMPGKDGGAVALELQTHPVLRDKPVLFLTSLISPAEAGEHEVNRGGRLFLAKPADGPALIAAIRRILGRRPTAGCVGPAR